MRNLYLKLDHETFHAAWLNPEQVPELFSELNYEDIKEKMDLWRQSGQFILDNQILTVDVVAIADQAELLVLSEALEDAETDQAFYIEAVKLVNTVFNTCRTPDDICLQGVMFMKDIVGVDRAGILLLSEDRLYVQGTWGTNDQGEIVQEQDLQMPLENNHWMGDALAQKGQLIIKDNVELTNYATVVGKGWNAIMAIYHEQEPIGWLCCDNLVSGRLITNSLKAKIIYVAYMLGQWLTRLRYEDALKNLNDTLEFEVKQKTKDLEQTIEILKTTQSELVHTERTKALSTFTAGVAHEINNPIGFIRSNLSFIGKVSSKVLETLAPLDAEELEKPKVLLGGIDQVIDESVEGLDRVTNIISMLQPLNKLADEEAQLFDIGQAIEFAVMGLPDSSPKVGVQNTLSSQMVNLPMQIFTLALENLIENAIKATREEAQPKISIAVSENDSELCVSCSDNGGGITEDHLEQIFLPFFTTRSPGDGMGLGLSLSQNLIQLAGGGIRVSSKETEGSTFTIHFPKDVIQHG